MSSFTDKLIKGAVSGAIAGGVSMIMGEGQGSTTIGGFQLPNPLAIGGSVAASSVIADVAHDYALPYISASEKMATIESVALGGGLSGGATALILNKENLFTGQTLNAFLLGAGSYYAGDYINNRFLDPTRG